MFCCCSTAELDPQQLRGLMALVAQEPVLFDGSIRYNISYGRQADELDSGRRDMDESTLNSVAQAGECDRTTELIALASARLRMIAPNKLVLPKFEAADLLVRLTFSRAVIRSLALLYHIRRRYLSRSLRFSVETARS